MLGLGYPVTIHTRYVHDTCKKPLAGVLFYRSLRETLEQRDCAPYAWANHVEASSSQSATTPRRTKTASPYTSESCSMTRWRR